MNQPAIAYQIVVVNGLAESNAHEPIWSRRAIRSHRMWAARAGLSSQNAWSTWTTARSLCCLYHTCCCTGSSLASGNTSCRRCLEGNHGQRVCSLARLSASCKLAPRRLCIQLTLVVLPGTHCTWIQAAVILAFNSYHAERDSTSVWRSVC